MSDVELVCGFVKYCNACLNVGGCVQVVFGGVCCSSCLMAVSRFYLLCSVLNCRIFCVYRLF